MPESVVRAGVVGVGALGRHHARVWAGVAGARLVGPDRDDAGVVRDDADLCPELELVSLGERYDRVVLAEPLDRRARRLEHDAVARFGRGVRGERLASCVEDGPIGSGAADDSRSNCQGDIVERRRSRRRRRGPAQ